MYNDFEISKRIDVEYLDEIYPEVSNVATYCRWGINVGSLNIPDSCMLSLSDKLWCHAETNKKSLFFIGVVGYTLEKSRLNRKWNYWHLHRKERAFEISGKPENGIMELDKSLGYFTVYKPIDSREVATLASFSLMRIGVFVITPAMYGRQTQEAIAKLLEREVFYSLPARSSQAASILIDGLLKAGFCVVNATGGFDSGGVHFNFWNCAAAHPS